MAIEEDVRKLVAKVAALEAVVEKLKGGTTGQTLTKASDDDLDVEWS